MVPNQIAFTRFTSANSPLSKRYFVENGKLSKQAAAQMTRGEAERLSMSFAEFAKALEDATASQAFGYGIYASHMPNVVGVTISGKAKPSKNLIARTKKFFQYRGSGVMMLDHDPSQFGPNMSPDTLLDALVAVHPEIAQAARIERGSISAGVHDDCSPKTEGKGFHLYFPVSDTSGLAKYGALLADRLWLAGFGFIALSSNGKMLERTIIDTCVFSPERLDFVGKPVLSDGITYTAPDIHYFEGGMLDISSLKPLSNVEKSRVKDLKTKALVAMIDAANQQAERWQNEKMGEMLASGVSKGEASINLQRFSESEHQDLYDDFPLHFANGIGAVTVADVLAEPMQFDGKALADPIEGKDYGTTTAKFYWNNGKPVIHSFAHGQDAKYFLHTLGFDELSTENNGIELPIATRKTGIRVPELTELGNALRLKKLNGENIRYCPEAKAWLHWKNGGWIWDIDGARIRSLAADLHTAIYKEGELHPAKYGDYASWAKMSQKRSTIENAVVLLKDFEPLRLPINCIDSEPMLVGINNGQLVLDLKNGTTRPANQSDYITKSVSVNFMGQSEKAVRWQAFLQQVFEGDDELINWLQRWCGYLLSGSTKEQFFVFCYGLGANGKSVFADVIRYILGDYARAIAVETLTESKRQAGAASPDLVDLVGARLAISSETEDGVALAESLVKSLVSGDAMSVRKLHGSPFQFFPCFKLMMLGNHKPIIRGSDNGIWRRIRLVPFNRVFKEQERDHELSDKLKAEAPHILAWMVHGAINWQLVGLADIPHAIRRSTDDYRSEQDIIGQWISEQCEQSAAYESNSGKLYKNYCSWAVDNGLRPWSHVAFGRRLKERCFDNRKSNGRTIWIGIRPNDEVYLLSA